MSPIWIALFVFVVLAAVVSVFYRKAVLSKLEWLPGETVLWEQEKGRYYATYHNGRETMYIGGKVLLTNFRLILAQKVLLQKEHSLHFLLYWRGRGPGGEMSLKETMKRGYVEMDVTLESLQLVEDKKGKKLLSLKIPREEGTMLLPKEFRIQVEDVEELQKTLESMV